MKKYTLIIIGLFFVFTLACGNSPKPTEAPANNVGDDFTDLPAILVGKQGTVEVAPSKAKDYQPAFLGMQLQTKDNVKTYVASLADIFCQDGTTQRVDADREEAVACKNGGDAHPLFAPLERVQDGRSSLVLPPRESPADYGNVPVVLSPRNTKLLTPNPTFAWSAVDGAQSYTVIIKAPEGEVWRGEMDQSTLTYPTDAPKLTAGTTYLLSVEAVMDAGADPRVSKEVVYFSVLSSDAIEEVRALEADLDESVLLPSSKRYVLATLYTDRELYHAAVETYAALVAEDAQPAYLNALGDAYVQIKLYAPALDAYTRAVELASELGDKASRADAEAGLGRAYHGYDNAAEARKHFEASLALYKDLGMDEEVAWVKGLMEKVP